ncbi:MAG TPA: diguanylate cyclase [Solirubrobacterales bacterium]|nr:diguanylate cyclase [Solirubrobacterales bacterium]
MASGSPNNGSVSGSAGTTLRTLARRLNWRGLGPSMVREDRVTMARTFTYLFGTGATLVLLSLLFPHSPGRDTTGLLITTLGAYLVAIGFLVAWDRLPLWAFEASPLAGTAVVSLAVYFSGPEAATAYALFYLWVALAACYFLRPPVAFTHLGIASAAYALVLVVSPGHVMLPGLTWAMVTGTLAVLGILMTTLRGQLDQLVKQLAAAARTDSLTQLANRRELEERFAAELERSTRTARPLSIVVLDLDWFKEYNDRFGHSAGDRVLVLLAQALKRATRTSDVVARLGGEEFGVLAPETDETEAYLLSERLRAEVRSAFARETEKMTISCGVASFPIHGITLGELLHAADRALYEAKESGRDRSVVFKQAGVEGVEREQVAIERTSPRLASLVSLAEAVDRRKGSPANSRRVARYAEALARKLRLPEEESERVRIAALLRDVGEVGVAESILNKDGPLDPRERLEVERHPEIGARIVGAAQLGRVGEWILTHHERPDGQGYPRGLREHQIPLEGRIVAVADAYAAMTADRPYRRPFSPHRARAELQARAGTQFDHDVVEAFLELDGELDPDRDKARATEG